MPKDGGKRSAARSSRTTRTNLQIDNLDRRAPGARPADGRPAREVYDTGWRLGGPIVQRQAVVLHRAPLLGQPQTVAGNYFNTQSAALSTNRTRGRRSTTTNRRLQRCASRGRRPEAQVIVRPIYRRTAIATAIEHARQRGARQRRRRRTAASYRPTNYLPQATWTYPATNRLLLEAGGVRLQLPEVPTSPERGVDRADMQHDHRRRRIPAAPAPSAGVQRVRQNRSRTRGSASYVTGSHNFKAGLQVHERHRGTPQRLQASARTR